MKTPAQDDPMELVGVRLPQGELDTMTRCVVEEYLLLGWDERQLLLLFTRPCFRATHDIYRKQGEAWVRARIAEVCRAWAQNASDDEANHAQGL